MPSKNRHELLEAAGRALGPIGEIIRQAGTGELTARELQLVTEHKNPFACRQKKVLQFFPVELCGDYLRQFEDECFYPYPLEEILPIGSVIWVKGGEGLFFEIKRYCLDGDLLLVEVVLSVDNLKVWQGQELAQYLREFWIFGSNNL